MLVNSLFRSSVLRATKPSNGAIFTKSTIQNVKRNHILKQSPKCPTSSIHFPRSFSNAVTYKNTSSEYAQMLSRTHKCGEISSSHIGHKVRLCGWVSSKRLMGKLLFVVLRDMYGAVQVTFDLSNATPELEKQVNDLSIECVLSIEGTVRARPSNMINPQMKTGEVEILASDHHILNTCDLIPFDIRSEKLANEEIRFKYRFLDLRRASLQNNLKTRSQICHTIRNYLVDQGFLEIETPTLFKKTVESGAKEFLVPTRTIGKFYALPQSPQQYKQLLMAGGIDKYFQLARCYRDEGTRPDRQPEFTQVDMEMSFITPENIYQVIEGIIKNVWKKSLNIDIPTPFMRMKFDEAIDRFGVDKPDTRYAMEISDITDLVKQSQVALFSKLGGKDRVKIVNVKGLAKNCSQKDLEFLQDESKLMHEKGSIQIRVVNGEWKSPIAKHLSESEKKSITEKMNVEDGDLLVIAVGPQLQSCTVLGRVRTQAANMLQAKGMLEIPADKFNFMWVVDFPLFSLEPELCSTHHPFTAPYTEDIPLLDSKDQDDLLKIRALHYDVVCNGVELGGGSIRIHDHLMQRKVFNIINIPNEGIQQFQHLLEALRYGCPPHGGIALGLDRLVAMVCKVPTLKEVIAFPKTTTGSELMSGAPSEMSSQDLKEFGLTYTAEGIQAIKKRTEN